MWKLSQFTVVRDLTDRGAAGTNLVFNTRTRRSLIVGSDNWRSILDELEAPGGGDGPVARAARSLVDSGYAVPAQLDERVSWAEEFDRTRYGRQAIYPQLTVTTSCNIACTYCFEEGVDYEHMTDEVVDATVRWFEQRVRDGVSAILPTLFGGEPLIVPRTLFRIMDGLLAFRERYGTDVRFSGSSNGMLLNDDLAEQLAGRGLERLQISLDGPERIHDIRRIGHRGQGTFERSLAGLHVAARHLPYVTLKINFDRQNLEFSEEIFDRIEAEGLAGRIEVKLEAIALQLPGSGTHHDPAFVIPPDSPEMAAAYTGLRLQAEERGIRVTGDTAHTTPCMLSSDHGVIIGSDGVIYKCVSAVGRPEMAVGTVFDGYDRVAYDDQMNVHARLDDCFDESCSYVPVCAGGCAYESMARGGSYKERFCTLPYLTEYHYLDYLVKHNDRLADLGCRTVTAEEMAKARVPAGGTTTMVELRTRSGG